MEVLKITAASRTKTGGSSGRQMRAAGRIPVNLYGNQAEARNISIDRKTFEYGIHKLKSENLMIDLEIEGESGSFRVFMREIQRDPLTGAIVHLDFLRIDETKKMHFDVAVRHQGVPEGVRQGGILDQHLRHIEIKCLPKDLPEEILIDITAIGMHQPVLVRDLPIPEAVEVLHSEDDVVFIVLPPKKVEEPTPEAVAVEGETKEPELVGGKKPKEEQEES